MVPFARKPQRKKFLKPIQKTVHACYVNFMFEFLDFYNVKVHTSVKTSKLASIIYIYIYIYMYMHNCNVITETISVNLTSCFTLALSRKLKVQSDCRLNFWGRTFWGNSSPLVAVYCFQKNVHLQFWLTSECASGYFLNVLKFFFIYQIFSFSM